MKIDLKKFIIGVITALLTALICWFAFTVFSLGELFGVEPSYPQWLGISIISTLLFTQPYVNRNDSKGPKIS
jgi:hypothetical protein